MPGEGRCAGTLGALLLGVHDEHGRLHYAGHVGSGVPDRALDEMRDWLIPLACTTSPFAVPVPRRYARNARCERSSLVRSSVCHGFATDATSCGGGRRPDRDPSEVARSA
ncbi:hypothetical protein ACFWQL_00845 [Amycolatopsis thermoflava]|uniref:ATP dependent DNA ligase n=1 Tax=Amycolatopsis thermoflava TaxID=84480 RepID=UPI00364679ED